MAYPPTTHVCAVQFASYEHKNSNNYGDSYCSVLVPAGEAGQVGNEPTTTAFFGIPQTKFQEANKQIFRIYSINLNTTIWYRNDIPAYTLC